MSSTMEVDLWKTTIHVINIHCSSCVSFIQQLLDPYRANINDIQINLKSHEICITHGKEITASKILRILDDAAFEVYDASSVDQEGKEYLSLDADGDSERSSITFKAPLKRTSDWFVKWQPRSWQLPKRRRQHAEKCEACRNELPSPPEHALLRFSGRPKNLVHGSASPIARSKRPLQTEETLVDTTRSSSTIPALKYPTPPATYKATLSISGMTCSSCTSAITRGVSELPGLESIDISLITNSATVVFTDPATLEGIVSAVDELGYECKAESQEEVSVSAAPSSHDVSIRTIALKIEGMYCGHCPSNITNALKSRFDDTVELLAAPSESNPIMKLAYTPRPPLFTVREIIDCIEIVNDSFKATVYNPPTVEERSQSIQRQEFRKYLYRLILCAIVAIPTFLIGVVWMSLVPKDNSVRQYFEQPLWAGNSVRRDWALLILATPVMFFAADIFHIKALKEIRTTWRKGSPVPFAQRFYRFGSMNLLISAGTSVAYFASIAVLAIDASSQSPSGATSTYFDSVVFLTLFILAGKCLESFSRAKTGDAVAMLKSLKSTQGVLMRPNGRVPPEMMDSEKTPIDHPAYGSTTVIDANLLEVDDVVLVPHATSPPADGVIVYGSTIFNESSLTGEARPVSKSAGDEVFTGTVNMGNAIQVRVKTIGGSSMIDQIIEVVREGQAKRAPVERIADTVTAYFVPVITALAILTWVIWLALGTSGALSRYFTSTPNGGWAFWSLEFAIAVFVVACPCGIGLAAPTALFVGSGLAAKSGILVRGGGQAFQEASKIDAVVFDKTGTLTEGGDLRVTKHNIFTTEHEAPEVAWAIAHALESTSSHPIAKAISTLAGSQAGSYSASLQTVSEEPGKGLRGAFIVNDTEYESAIGSESFITSLLQPTQFDATAMEALKTWRSNACSVALFALRNSDSATWRLALTFAIADTVRPSAAPTVAALRARGVPVFMITGDNVETANSVASKLDIPRENVFAGVLPAGKAERIRQLQDTLLPHTPPRSNIFKRFMSYLLRDRRAAPDAEKQQRDDCIPGEMRKKATVAFIGDGINDAPALTAANVSISLASGSDVALTSSDFILLNTGTGTKTPSAGDDDTPASTQSLSNIITLLDLSKRVLRRVKFNFAWAVAYNILLVPIAAGALFWLSSSGGWRMGPVWASLAMALSSLSVVGSSLALRFI